MHSADPRRSGAALNHLGFQHNFQVLSFPTTGNQAQHFIHALRVHQELARRYRASTTYAGSNDNVLIGLGINQSRHDHVVFINSRLQLFGTIQHPLALSRIATILDGGFILDCSFHFARSHTGDKAFTTCSVTVTATSTSNLLYTFYG